MSITQWSYSRFNDWVKCPRKAKYKYVDKLKEPPSAAADRGIRMHLLCTQYLEGKLPKVPEELHYIAPLLNTLKDKFVACEQQLAFKKDWTPTGWFDYDVYVRVKSDIIALDDPENPTEAMIIDLKTGKQRQYDDQLELYALGAMCQHPTVKTVKVGIWYIDSGEKTEKTYIRDDYNDLVSAWTSRVDPMLNDTTFAIGRNPDCKWCHFRLSNGGPCSKG